MLPKITESIAAGGSFESAIQATEACSARSVQVLVIRLPPNDPKAVRLAATMNTPEMLRLNE